MSVREMLQRAGDGQLSVPFIGDQDANDMAAQLLDGGWLCRGWLGGELDLTTEGQRLLADITAVEAVTGAVEDVLRDEMHREGLLPPVGVGAR